NPVASTAQSLPGELQGPGPGPQENGSAMTNWRRFANPALMIIAIALPLAAPHEYVMGVIARVCLYSILALGLHIVVGFAGLLDLAYVAFLGIGSHTYAFLASPQYGVHLPFLVALPIVVVISAILGVLIGAPTLRLRGDYLAIVTLGFGEIASQLASNGTVFGFNLTNGDTGIPVIDPIGTGPFGNIVGVPKALVHFAHPFLLLL